jgi:hypothetical protein
MAIFTADHWSLVQERAEGGYSMLRYFERTRRPPLQCPLPLRMTWRLIRKLVLILSRRQPNSLLPGLVIHLVGVDILTARAAAVDGPRTSLNLYVLGVALVG